MASIISFVLEMFGPYFGALLGRFRYIYIFLLGFVFLPLAVAAYAIFTTGISSLSMKIISSHDLGKDLAAFFGVCALNGAGAIFLAAIVDPRERNIDVNPDDK